VARLLAPARRIGVHVDDSLAALLCVGAETTLRQSVESRPLIPDAFRFYDTKALTLIADVRASERVVII
jgi:hypothetical protein